MGEAVYLLQPILDEHIRCKWIEQLATVLTSLLVMQPTPFALLISSSICGIPFHLRCPFSDRCCFRCAQSNILSNFANQRFPSDIDRITIFSPSNYNFKLNNNTKGLYDNARSNNKLHRHYNHCQLYLVNHVRI